MDKEGVGARSLYMERLNAYGRYVNRYKIQAGKVALSNEYIANLYLFFTCYIKAEIN